MVQSQLYPVKRIGEILVDANLLSPAQVQVALYDQQQFANMRLGEILVSRGWINQQTVDFFGDHWERLCAQGPQGRKVLGQYLRKAGLVDRDGVEAIIAEQFRNGYRFGANAVLLGFIRQQTLDFFLDHLFPDQKNESHDVLFSRQSIMESHPQGFSDNHRQHPRKAPLANKSTQNSASQSTQNSAFVLKPTDKRQRSPVNQPQPKDDDISWVG